MFFMADEFLEEPIAWLVFCCVAPQSGPEALRLLRSTAEAAHRIITGEPGVLCFSAVRHFYIEMSGRVTVRRFRRTATKAGGVRRVSSKDVERLLAKKVMRLEKSVRMVKPEIKWFDTDVSGTNVSTSTGLVTHLTAIASSAGVNGRIGNAVRIIDVELNWLPSLASTSVDGTQANVGARFYIVQDTQQVPDVAPAGGLLVDQPGLPFTQLLNVLFQSEFKILYDSGPQNYNYSQGPIQLGGATQGIVPEAAVFHRNIKIPVNIVTRFNGTGSGDIQKNGLYLFVFSNALLAGASSFDYFGTSRVKYVDV